MKITKKSIKERASRILNGAEIGSYVSEDDKMFLLNLLEGHPKAASKIGIGVKNIMVCSSRSMGFPGRHFQIERVDGSMEHFSYLKCLRWPSHGEQVSAALRRAVSRDVIAFKNEYFDLHQDAQGRILCPVTGRLLTADQVHVDHKPPNTFKQLVTAYLEREGLFPSEVELVGGPLGSALANDWLIGGFIKHHNHKADLQIIDIKANLRNQH